MTDDATTTITILGLAGSLRRASVNLALIHAAAELAPAGVNFEIASIQGIPLYDGDREVAEGLPPAVVELKARFAAADGILIATPEYNSSIPGVLKNAIDWLSRPPADIGLVFGDKPLALSGATPGRAGTALSQAAWLPVLRALGVRAWFGPRLMLSGAAQWSSAAADGSTRITEEKTRQQIAGFVRDFTAFIRAGAV